MCRLFMCDKKFLMTEGVNKIINALDRLEKECGGDGNGYALVKDGKVVEHAKGKELTNIEIVLNLYDDIEKESLKDIDWLIYHTRVASAGSIKDENCHPYVDIDNNFVLAMNGTELTFSDLAEDFDCTDTEMIFNMINKCNYDSSILRHLSPKFIGLQNGKVYATNPDTYYGGLQFIQDERGTCIASSFDVSYHAKKMKTSYSWKEGEVIEKDTYSYGSYDSYRGSNKYMNYVTDDYQWYYDYKIKQDRQDKVASTALDLIKEEEEKDRVPFEEYNSYERTYNEVREVVKIAERMLEYGLSVKETEAYINKEIGLMPTLVSYDYKELAELIIEVDDYGVTVKDDNGCVYYFN